MKTKKRKRVPHVKLLADKTYEWPVAEELGIELTEEAQAIVDRLIEKLASQAVANNSAKAVARSVRSFHEMYRYFVEGMGVNPWFNKGLELEISELHSDKDLGYGDNMTVRIYESLMRFVIDWSELVLKPDDSLSNLKSWRTWLASELSVIDKAIGTHDATKN